MPSADEHRGDEPQRRSLKGIVRASGLAALLGLAARKEQRSPHPQVVRGGPEVDAVVDLAEELAEQGRDDEAAVRQLRAAGKGRKGVLNRALAMTRMGPDGYVGLFDFRAGDLTDRLLVAAATGAPIQPRSGEQEAWFERIDRLRAGGPDLAYARLKAQVPDLDALEREVRAHVAANGSGAAVDDAWWESVYDRLEQTVGWKSQLADPMLRSGAAFAIAYSYLGGLADIFDD